MGSDVHCSQSGTEVEGRVAQKPVLSARTSSGPQNLNEIAEDNDFTVITTKKKRRKTKMKPTTTDIIMNTASPSSHIPKSRIFRSS
jgi:hypothetical protein